MWDKSVCAETITVTYLHLVCQFAFVLVLSGGGGTLQQNASRRSRFRVAGNKRKRRKICPVHLIDGHGCFCLSIWTRKHTDIEMATKKLVTMRAIR